MRFALGNGDSWLSMDASKYTCNVGYYTFTHDGLCCLRVGYYGYMHFIMFGISFGGLASR